MGLSGRETAGKWELLCGGYLGGGPMPQKHLFYIRALKGRTAERDRSLESTERDKPTCDVGLVGCGFARARQSVVDLEVNSKAPERH